MRRAGDDGADMQGVAVHIGIVAQNAGRGDGQRRVQVGRIGVVIGDRRVVHRIDGEMDGGEVGIDRAVIGLVGEAVRAVIVGIRRVKQRAVRIQRQRAMGRSGDQIGGQRVAIDIGIVAQNARHPDGQRRVFVGGEGIVHRHRRVVHRIDRQVDGGGIGIAGAVIGLVGEAVGAVEIGVGRIGEGAVAVQRQRAMGRARDHGAGQRIVFHIGVVAQHAGRGDGQGRVFVGGEGVIHRHRRVVHRIDGEIDGGDVGIRGPVIRLVGEAVGAVIIGVRRIGEGAVAVQRQGAMGRASDHGAGQRIVFRVGVVAQHTRRRDVERRVLVGDEGVVHRHGRVIVRQEDVVDHVIGAVGEADELDILQRIGAVPPRIVVGDGAGQVAGMAEGQRILGMEPLIDRRIRSGAAIQHIVALAAGQHVVAGAAGQAVGAIAADQRRGDIARDGEVEEAAENIALAIEDEGAGAQIRRDRIQMRPRDRGVGEDEAVVPGTVEFIVLVRDIVGIIGADGQVEFLLAQMQLVLGDLDGVAAGLQRHRAGIVGVGLDDIAVEIGGAVGGIGVGREPDIADIALHDVAVHRGGLNPEIQIAVMADIVGTGGAGGRRQRHMIGLARLDDVAVQRGRGIAGAAAGAAHRDRVEFDVVHVLVRIHDVAVHRDRGVAAIALIAGRAVDAGPTQAAIAAIGGAADLQVGGRRGVKNVAVQRNGGVATLAAIGAVRLARASAASAAVTAIGLDGS